MQPEPPADVLSRIDLREMADATEWANSAMVKRPWREELFQRLVDEVSRMRSGAPSILEIGSGPGFLACRLLEALPDAMYVALDFSEAMHRIARERLGELSRRVTFLERDFKDLSWSAGLSQVDVVVTMQAVHELRHKRHAPSFYRTVRSVVRSEGFFLMCDHFAGEDGMSNTALFMTPEEHEEALRAGGFSRVELVLQKGGLVLFRAHGVP